MPQVSVIIPTHNRAETVRAAITSVLSQSFQDFEIIVVDDASVDHTASVVQGFDDPRIRYLRNAANKGEGGSRNKGLLNAQGDFIAFLDDDDEWLPEKLKLQVDLLERSSSNVGGVYTGFFKIDKISGRQWARVCPTKRGNILNDILSENWIASSTLLLRKECFEKAGLFEEGMTFGADYDMWLRVASKFDFECVAKPLVIYYIHGNNVTSNYETVIRGLEAQLSRYGSFWVSNSKGYSQRYLSLGVLYCYTGDVKRGRAAFAKAIKLYPFEVRYYYYLVLSFFGADVYRKFSDTKEAVIFKMREHRLSHSRPNASSH